MFHPFFRCFFTAFCFDRTGLQSQDSATFYVINIFSFFLEGRSEKMEADQGRILSATLEIVKSQAFYMKRAMDSNELEDALKHATDMLDPMRSNTLSPKNYYELYMTVNDEMRELEEFFSTLYRSGEKKMMDLYQEVQSCGAVVPRLYLMFCVGGVYIQSKETPAKDILRDMVEMVKGVQHPMRGLFLRHYLSQVARDKLPDIGSPYEGAGGGMSDAYYFILQNFTESNRLWIRLQTHGQRVEKKKRERERRDLRLLVGTNLVRLSQLEGLEVLEYKESLLPKLLEEIVSCRDTLAQSYLMDCIIQVFPDEFHIATLGLFLDTLIKLKERVGIRTILSALVERLAGYVESSGLEVLPVETNAFKLMNECVTTLIMERTNMTLVETLNLQNILTDFALRCYSGNSSYVSHCLKTCCSLIEKTDFAPRDNVDTGEEDESLKVTRATIQQLLSTVLSSLALRVMELPHVATLMSYLHWDSWKEVASKLLRAVINADNKLHEPEDVEQLFGMITPLLRDHEAVQKPNEDDEEEVKAPEVSAEFKAEQLLVARVVHLMEHEDTDVQFMMYGFAKKNFTNGGKARMQHTFTPLVFASLNLARRVYAIELARAAKLQEIKEAGEEAQQDAAEVKGPRFGSKKVLQLVLEILSGMATTFPEMALKLFLSAAQAADEFNYSAIAYEFLKEALLTYESEVTDSKAQMRVLHAIIGTLLTCRNFSTEDYEALITKTAQYANKMLRKPDQCKMITLCSHLFWPKRPEEDATRGSADFYDDSERVQECLERALKIASVCNPMLFVDILDHYVYYYENNNPIIQARYISGLIALINEQFASGQADPVSLAHYKNTIEYIKMKQGEAESGAKFSSIQC